MKVWRIVRALEAIAPPALAADWDNVGLLVGDPSADARKLLLCVDLTEQAILEAARVKAAMVMAYHPVMLKPLARLTPGAAPVVYAAARRGLAVYSMHTALDAAPGGTNDVLADTLGLTDRRPLEPIVRQAQCKAVVFTPPDDLSRVADAAFAAGAGRIGDYSECAFFGHGIGTFLGGPSTHPALGRSGRHEAAEELRLEVVVPKDKVAAVCDAIRAAHSYEEPAIDVYPLEEHPAGCGLGRIGRLKRPATVKALIGRIKKATGVKHLLLACGARPPRGRKTGDGRGALVSTAACCAGSCGSVFRAAIAGGATFYLTGEMRHHDALESAAAGMTVVCLGHSNSERIALSRLTRRLREALPKLAVSLCACDRDPFEVA